MLDLTSVPVLETERLRLRRFEERDLDTLAEIFADPLVMRYIGDGRTGDRAETWRAMAAYLGHWALRGYGLFAVEERAGGVLVGRIGLWNPAGWPGLELGWLLGRRYWGRGYATEGALAVRHWAYDTLGAPRLISLIRPDNASSRRVAARIGSRPEGVVELSGRPAEVWAQARTA